MSEPEQIEFHERVQAQTRPGMRSVPVRIGIVAGSAVLVVVGAVAAMGASPASPPAAAPAGLAAVGAATTGAAGMEDLDAGFRGGLGRGAFRDITISAINGSSLALQTEDGWSRTIAVGSATTITKAGQAITLGDLAVGDQIRFAQAKAADGTYSITAIRVVVPAVGGEVTAVSGSTITVTRKDGTTDTIHVDGDTTYDVGGTTGKALSDITVGAFVIAEGTLRTDGSLDADAVHSGFRGARDGGRGGHDFPGNGPDANETPAPTPPTAS